MNTYKIKYTVYTKKYNSCSYELLVVPLPRTNLSGMYTIPSVVRHTTCV